MRCRKYYTRGKRNGTVTSFLNNLPGLPDNIGYDGKGSYWIALVAVKKEIKFISFFLSVIFNFDFLISVNNIENVRSYCMLKCDRHLYIIIGSRP